VHEKVTLVVAKLWLPTHYVHIIFFCRPDVDCIQLEKYKRDRLQIQVTYKAIQRFFLMVIYGICFI
jgi:hypothetical protein